MLKKCMRCKIVFHLEERSRCLYCDALLMAVEKDDTKNVVIIPPKNSVLKKVVEERKYSDLGRMEFIIGSYFKSRTFQFTYHFCRGHYKIGREYSRFFIQPLNYTSFLTIPWVIYNFLDTLIFRVIYNGYCEKCGWKFSQFSGKQEHDPRECEYNYEYSTLIKEILNGNIAKNERKFKQEAVKKIELGKRSAYHDLCSRKKKVSGIIDVASIWISLCLILYLIMWLVSPAIMGFVNMIKSIEYETIETFF